MDEISNTQQITLIKKIFVNLRMEQFLVKMKNYKKKNVIRIKIEKIIKANDKKKNKVNFIYPVRF